MIYKKRNFTANHTKFTNLCFDIKQRVRMVSAVRSYTLLLFLFFLIAPIFAQTQQLSRQRTDGSRQPWWLTLEQGKLRFRNGDYGGALLQFEDARRQRREQFEQMERDLIHLLSEREVRRLGDSLDIIERYSRDFFYNASTAALEELFYRVPRARLNNSAAKALEELGKLKDYPEAEFWIGEVYRVEGEFPLALRQYQRALSMQNLMEDPLFGVTLKYKIANIYLVTQDYNRMIDTHLAIINEHDTLWIHSRNAEVTGTDITRRQAEAQASFASSAMGRTLENEGIGRFLEMYRYNNTTVENAHRQLGLFYAVTGVPRAQQHLMQAFLIQNTIILEEIVRRKFDFTLADPNPPRRPQPSARELLLIGEEIRRNPMLSSFAEEVEYFKTAYYLAASLYRNGRLNIARNLWEFLAEMPEAGEWHNRAVQQLQSPRLEPIVERP